MSRIIIIVILFFLALTITSCGLFTEINTEIITEANTESCLTATKQKSGSIRKEKILFDQDNIKVAFLGFDPVGGTWGPEIHLRIDNNSNNEYLFQVREFKVNDIYVTPLLSNRAMPGESISVPIYILPGDLRKHEIEVIKNIEFTFYIMENSTTANVIESDKITLIVS